jgi:CD47 immunoglobulin-like domain
MFCAMNQVMIRMFCEAVLHPDFDIPYHITWYFNGTIIKNNGRDSSIFNEIIESKTFKGIKSTFEIETSSQTRDAGYYTCSVTDFFNNTKSKTELVYFIQTPKVNFTIMNPTKTTTRCDCDNNSVTFDINYQTCPYTKLSDTEDLVFMTNPKNETVKLKELKRNAKFEISQEPNILKFTIKNPDMNDFGNFTFSGNYSTIEESHTMKLIVNGKNMQPS